MADLARESDFHDIEHLKRIYKRYCEIRKIGFDPRLFQLD